MYNTHLSHARYTQEHTCDRKPEQFLSNKLHTRTHITAHNMYILYGLLLYSYVKFKVFWILHRLLHFYCLLAYSITFAVFQPAKLMWYRQIFTYTHTYARTNTRTHTKQREKRSQLCLNKLKGSKPFQTTYKFKSTTKTCSLTHAYPCTQPPYSIYLFSNKLLSLLVLLSAHKKEIQIK